MGAKGDQAKGQAKEVVGKVVGDKDLEAEGKADRRAGEAKEKVEDVKDFVEDVVDKAKDTAEDIVDKAKDATHRK
ncbi:MAG: CsbD family protein [Acidimicrobiales bacterium]